jgi:NADH dehydrogenase
MNIVIIGAGISGIYLLQLLKKKLPEDKFIIIDKKDSFVFTPRLTEVFSNTIKKNYSFKPTELTSENVEVIITEIDKIDLKNKFVKTQKQKINYDIIVFSHGAKTNFYSDKKLEKSCLEFKDINDTIILQNKIIKTAKKIRDKKIKIAIIGGGPTGTELAFSLIDYIDQLKSEGMNISLDNFDISILQGGDKLIKGMPKYFINKVHKEAEKQGIKVFTNKYTSKIINDIIYFKDGKNIKSDIVIWTAGVIANKLNIIPTIETRNYSIVIEKTLQIKRYKNCFAIGDCSIFFDDDKKPYPKTAQVAIQQAKHLSKNIINYINNKPLENFSYKPKGVFLTLNNSKTLVNAKTLNFNGILGGLFRDLYYKHIFKKLKKK